MLPQAYGLPVAILLVLGGTLACFTGYRLLRTVLGIYGFILGAMLASSFRNVSCSSSAVTTRAAMDPRYSQGWSRAASGGFARSGLLPCFDRM